MQKKLKIAMMHSLQGLPLKNQDRIRLCLVEKSWLGDTISQKKLLMRVQNISTLGELLEQLRIKNHLNLAAPEDFIQEAVLDGYALDSDEPISELMNLQQDLPIIFQ